QVGMRGSEVLDERGVGQYPSLAECRQQIAIADPAGVPAETGDDMLRILGRLEGLHRRVIVEGPAQQYDHHAASRARSTTSQEGRPGIGPCQAVVKTDSKHRGVALALEVDVHWGCR